MRKICIFFFIAHALLASLVSVMPAAEAPVEMQFYGKNLGDLLQKIAEIKNANILLPSGSDQIGVTINFSTPKALPLEEIEEYLLYFLDMAGYRLSIQGDILVVGKKTDISAQKIPMPLYIDVLPEDLPNNIGPIRVIYFLKNLRVDSKSGTLGKIIHDILPDNKSTLVDPRSNCVIITGPANAIAAAMTIILELDNYGLKDEVAIVKLMHTSSAVVSRLLEEIILATKESNPMSSSTIMYTGGSYFSPNIKIISEPRTNSLILLGKSPAVNKLIDFIQNDLDLPQESGNCVVHVYTLKYLDAKKTAPILQSLVSGKTNSGQSVRDAAATPSYYRVFDGARIIAEETVQSEVTSSKEGKAQGKLILGGNRLIIAASQSDYNQIEDIIKRIDQPQHQVIIEVMILDLDVDKTGNLSSQFRLPHLINSLTNIGMQTVMQDNSQIIINDPTSSNAITDATKLTPLSTITSDLLSPITSSGGGGGEGGGSATGGTESTIIDIVPRTGIIISLGEQFQNMGIAAILQCVENIYSRNIVANPSIVTQNNIKTEIKNIQVRRGEGKISSNSAQYGGATVVDVESYAAVLGINFTPHINPTSSTNGKTHLNLEVDINIEEFKDAATNDYTKITRGIKTSINLCSGNLLILGGLYKKGKTKRVAKTPILGSIPIVGALFRRTSYEDTETNLVVIMRATVIEPYTNESLTAFTKRKMNVAKEELEDVVLGKVKDPITRMYFQNSLLDHSDRSIFLKPQQNEYDEKRKILTDEEKALQSLYENAVNPFS